MSDHEFDFEICNSRIRPIAEALVEKYEELEHVDPSKILFVLNHKSGGGGALAATSKVPFKWTELLFQLGACSYFYMVEFYSKKTSLLDDNQMTALLYRELRKIDSYGEIVKPDVNEWWTLLIGLGKDWCLPDKTCPNLLDDDTDWKRLMGSYYEKPKA